MNLALVTCGFTTYNAEGTISRALFSAFNQTYKNLEIVVVDDKSNDNTLKKVEEVLIQSPYPYKIIKHKENLGVAASRNSILNYAKGEFIVFFDDDDLSYPHRVENQINTILNFEKKYNLKKTLQKSPLCYCYRKIIFNSNRTLICKSIFLNTFNNSNIQGALALLSASGFPLKAKVGSTATCILCSRKETLLNIGGFNNDLRRFEDLDLAIKALKINISLVSCEEVLVDQYFVNNSSKSKSYIYENIMINFHKDFLEKYSLYKFALSYSNFKNSVLTGRFMNSFKYILILFFRYPLKTFSSGLSSTKTIFFTILNTMNTLK